MISPYFGGISLFWSKSPYLEFQHFPIKKIEKGNLFNVGLNKSGHLFVLVLCIIELFKNFPI